MSMKEYLRMENLVAELPRVGTDYTYPDDMYASQPTTYLASAKQEEKKGRNNRDGGGSRGLGMWCSFPASRLVE